jgi:hypothetical protein
MTTDKLTNVVRGDGILTETNLLNIVAFVNSKQPSSSRSFLSRSFHSVSRSYVFSFLAVKQKSIEGFSTQPRLGSFHSHLVRFLVVFDLLILTPQRWPFHNLKFYH